MSNVVGQQRIGELSLDFSAGWHETADRKKGHFKVDWGPCSSWEDVILQGPHFYVSTPFNKSPNATLRSNKDWSRTDFERLPIDAVPITVVKPDGETAAYDSHFTQWNGVPARSRYRVAWRTMAANYNERTLIPSLIPPGAAHLDAVFSAGTRQASSESLCVVAAFLSSILVDFTIRTAPKGHIRSGAINRLPIVMNHPLQAALMIRTLRLNCVVNAYATLWREAYRSEFANERWASGRNRTNRFELAVVDAAWTGETPLRIPEDRRQALVEIDALVALMLGVTADQLCTIYRTQFAVLYGYDHWDYVYDTNGRLVPNSVLSNWRKKGDRLSVEERTATNQSGNTYTYGLPFTLLDREADMRQAYAEFERRLTAHG